VKDTFDTLAAQTRVDSARFLSIPFVRWVVEDRAHPLPCYVDFLRQSYHHVKHTVRLLAAAASAHPQEPVRKALVHYINDEYGHEEWVLGDLRTLGVDVEEVRRERPYPTTEALVSYVYHAIQNVNPWSMFGMIWVLEGNSVGLAQKYADAMQRAHGLPKEALVYLTTHGVADLGHIEFFKNTLNAHVESQRDLDDVVQAAKVVYRLWGEIFVDHSEKYGLARAFA
jgi:long-chain acyl-CoA synthetase